MPNENRPRLLDLFCGAGGAAMGYHRAGFDVVGVDIKPQKHYPFPFVQADALEYVAEHGGEFDVIHASPPCQRYSRETPEGYKANHPDLIVPIRTAILATGKPYIIENVQEARKYLLNPVMLCGTMFGLTLWRHRFFEVPILGCFSPMTCRHDIVPVLVTGTPRRKRRDGSIDHSEPSVDRRRWAMDISWMTGKELDEAIPPAYTEWIGRYLMTALEGSFSSGKKT